MPTQNKSIEEKKSSGVFVIRGEPASKANSRRWTGRLFIKSKKALDYSKAFKEQCPVMEPMLTGDLVVHIFIYYASRRPDLDESLILDLMQGCVYENDRAVKERHVYWGLDKENPRAEILVEVLDGLRS